MQLAEFSLRRKQLMEKIGPQSVAILISAPHYPRNGDAQFPYRQQSDFYYLTGFQEPESIAVLIPQRKEGEFILFNRPNQPEKELWEGRFAGQLGACAEYGANASYPFSEFKDRLPHFLEGRSEIHYSLGIHQHFDYIILQALNRIRGKIRSGVQSPPVFVDVIETIHEMRLIKSAHELECMRTAAEISARGHLAAMKRCKPGINEYQLEAELTYAFQKEGARYPAYVPIVGGGENSCTLHYTANNQIIQDGDMVLIDAGGEYQYYAADITRTFPANGEFSGEQRAVYEIVLAAEEAGIAAVKPNAPWSIVQDKMLPILTQGLVDLGILKGNVSDLIEQEAYSPYYMHKSGHWLGLDVHDAGRYKVGNRWRLFEANMVLTVEPGLYLSSTIPGLDPRWHGIGVRIEDDVVVTESGREVLSHGVPKSVEDIESVMR